MTLYRYGVIAWVWRALIAFGFVLAGSSFAGAPDGGLPGVGTFQYSGSPVTTASSQPIVVAARL